MRHLRFTWNDRRRRTLVHAAVVRMVLVASTLTAECHAVGHHRCIGVGAGVHLQIALGRECSTADLQARGFERPTTMTSS